jgi:hypothetical protein
LPIDQDGVQTSILPRVIPENGNQVQQMQSVYLEIRHRHDGGLS